MKIYAQKIDGEIRDKEAILESVLVAMGNMKDGCVEIDVERAKKHRSPKQVKMIFGLMIKDTIAQANEAGIDTSDFLKYLVNSSIPKGQGLTKGFLHEIMYAVCPTTDDEGRRVTLSKMNTEQAGKLFEGFRKTVAGAGIYIDDPNPDWEKAQK